MANVENHQRNLFNALMSIDRVLRYTMMIIAKPTATSAAAKAIMNNTKTWPAGSPLYAEKATKSKLTELSISSIDIMMMITFRLVRAPTTPIAKMILQKSK